LTADELWITVGLSATGGLALGLPCGVLTHQWALLPTLMVACVATGVFVGGTLLRRQKRGRPETWLYRQLQWWMRRHVPVLAGFVGGGDLIVRSGYWTIRRTRKEAMR
jgi:conjugative transfer region protein (TIGR03750 family)